jgi:translin
MRFDYPDALVSIRRKQDIARSLLEKTRGELAVAVSSKILGDKISALYKKL